MLYKNTTRHVIELLSVSIKQRNNCTVRVNIYVRSRKHYCEAIDNVLRRIKKYMNTITTWKPNLCSIYFDLRLDQE